MAPLGDGRGTVGGMVSLATRQTPQIDDNTPARGGITMYNGVWRVAKLTIPRPSTVGAHSLHFNVHIVERTFLRSWTRMVLSSFFIVFQSVDPLSTARGNTNSMIDRLVFVFYGGDVGKLFQNGHKTSPERSVHFFAHGLRMARSPKTHQGTI